MYFVPTYKHAIGTQMHIRFNILVGMTWHLGKTVSTVLVTVPLNGNCINRCYKQMSPYCC